MKLHKILTEEVSVYFFDEGRFGLLSTLNRKWAKKGTPCTVKVRQGYENFYVYTSVNPKSGEQFSLLLPHVNTDMMQVYLNELSLANSGSKIILIMDQAGWHKSKILIVPENIEIWFLPPYSPELNPVERLWKTMKQEIIHNRIYKTLIDIEDAVVNYIRDMKEDFLKTLCSCSYL